MCFDRVLKIVQTVMPLLTVVVSALFIPYLLEKLKYLNLRCCYNSLFSYYDKICLSLGTKSFLYNFREDTFDSDPEIESLIKSDQDAAPSGTQVNWLPMYDYKIKTALNNARIKAGLGEGRFYYSRHFTNDNCGELLILLIIIKNSAEIHVFKRGEWEFQKVKTHNKRNSKCHSFKIGLFGYKRSEYSIMLV
jgi:hypothetical protein